jgi:hypothetical protein
LYKKKKLANFECNAKITNMGKMKKTRKKLKKGKIVRNWRTGYCELVAGEIRVYKAGIQLTVYTFGLCFYRGNPGGL